MHRAPGLFVILALLTGSRHSPPFFGATCTAFPTWTPSRAGPFVAGDSTHLALFSTCTVSISDKYDGGSIEYVQTIEKGRQTRVILRLRKDPYTKLEKRDHSQYFSFRSTVQLADDDRPRLVEYVIANAMEASYEFAWEGSTVCTSTTHSDPDSWTRILDTIYKDGKLSWTQEHTSSGSVYFAYYPPFSYERHLGLIAKCAAAENALVMTLGQSLDRREIECIKAGNGPRIAWIIHRQHPGESMAEFYAEGLLTRLLGLQSAGSVDGMVRRALDMYTFYIVSNMNPDGAQRGYLRTNAYGANLNREWASSNTQFEVDYYEAPTLEYSPEVFCVLSKMDETGVDVFLDVHGDENIPYNFLAGAEKCVNWGPRLENLHGAFLAAYCRANSDMNQKFGYKPEVPRQKLMNTASSQVAVRFDCLAATLEMPFKDCLSNPDPIRGWSPARARMLGASVLDALVYVHPYLRDKSEFWESLPENDAYVQPTDKYKE